MYIRTLTIENLRSFAAAAFEFQFPGRENESASLPNVNLLLGGNGAGKTTVLKGIALALLAPAIESSGFLPYRLVRRSSAGDASRTDLTAQVSLHGQDVGSTDQDYVSDAEMALSIDRILPFSSEKLISQIQPTGHWVNMHNDQSPAFLIVGYGASRRIESSGTFDESVRGRSRLLRYQRVAGLFEEQVTLTPLSTWLPRFKTENPGRYTQLEHLLNQLLPPECRFDGEIEEGEVVFRFRDTPTPFGALSDGYRAYLGWVADLLYHVCMGSPSGAKLVDNRGVVLVDEIDLHLHPEWQRNVVPTIATALPNLQFVLSTHSPIVAGTLESANIFLMESDQSGVSTVRRPKERIHGLNAEQILLSSYFNLESTRAPGTVNELHELARQARLGNPSAAVAFVQRLAEGSESEIA